MKVVVSTDDGSVKQFVFNKGTDTSVLESLKPFYSETLFRKPTENKITKIYILESSSSKLKPNTDKKKVVFFQNDGSIELRAFENIKFNNDSFIENSKTVLGEKSKKNEKDAAKKTSAFVQPIPQAFDILKLADSKPLDVITGMFDTARLEEIQKKSKKRSYTHDEFVSVQLLNDIGKPTFCIGTKSGLIHIIQVENDKLKFMASHEVRAPMDFLQYNDVTQNKTSEPNHVLAYGGEENLIKLIQISNDFKSMDQVWEAKNVKNDKLDLKVPIWPMSVVFTPTNGSQDETKKLNFEFLEITKTGYIRHYKTQHGRKPLDSIDIIHDRPLQRQQWPNILRAQLFQSEITLNGNAVASFNDSSRIVLADSSKNMLQLDPIKGFLKGKYGHRDIYGVTSCIKNFENKYLVCGGIDGYLRIYDAQSRNRLAKVYCKHKVLDCILEDDAEVETVESLKKAKKLLKKRKLTQEEEDQENEKLWGDLENQGSSKKLKN
ncbi:hypothetical protein ACO0RG_003383 [Hanseniaspora osmophila]